MTKLITLALLLTSLAANAADIRAMFIYPLTNSSSTPGLVEITNKVALLRRSGCNTYLANVTSTHAAAITNGTAWDDIADIIRVSKAAGVKSYLWFAPYYVKSGSAELTAHPEWESVTRAGVTNPGSLCLFRPEVRAWEYNILTNLADRYTDLTGIHLEEPGYDSINYCCCAYCTNWFQVNYGLDITQNTTPVWNAQAAEYSYANSNFVASLRAYLNPLGKKLSSNTQSYGNSTSQRIGNWWSMWTTNNLIDWFAPQIYYSTINDVTNSVAAIYVINPAVNLVPILGATYSTSSTIMLNQVHAIKRNWGLRQIAVFRQEQINDAWGDVIGVMARPDAKVSILYQP